MKKQPFAITGAGGGGGGKGGGSDAPEEEDDLSLIHISEPTRPY